MSTFNERLDQIDRLRRRARWLHRRTNEVIDQPGQFLRAMRIHARAQRIERKADEALKTLSQSVS